MNITRNTYENYFIDYLDGNLSDNEIKILIEFLDKNPDLEEELKDLTSFSKQQETNTITPDLSFSNSLKKEPIFDENESNFDELCISFYEGLLNEKEEQHLLELTESRNDLLHIFEAYSFTKVKANKSITFPNKSALKKHKRILWHQYVSYAASIIFVLGFIFYIQKDKISQQQTTPNSYAKNSYMDYPKVESFKQNSFAHNTNSTTELTNPTLESSTIRNQNPTGNSHKTIAVTYNKKQLEDFEKNNPLSFSRKGKLSYSNLSDLEKHLTELFAEKKINEDDFTPIPNKNVINKQQEIINKQFKLATTIDPMIYQKQILGSQPVE